MNQVPVHATVAQRYRGLLIIWFAQFVTLGLFVLVVWLTRVPRNGSNDALRFWVFDVLGGATFALSFVLKYKLLRRASEQQRPDVVTTAYVLAFALCEATAIFGLVNYFLSGVPPLTLFAVALFGMALHVPRRVELLKASPPDGVSFKSSLQ
ncbi:MAG: hypothetical protein DMF64_17500 [Acidobacteria bacterium]|nr:MAG: hypothetical protein DMF64_17500 [Acidobacteriota bacterium]